MNARKELQVQLREVFIPHALGLGFYQNPVNKGYLRKRSTFTDFFDFYWDKRGRPRFVIDSSAIPADFPIQPDQPFPRDTSGFGRVEHDKYRLKPRSGPTTRSWYCLDKPWSERLFSSDKYYPVEPIVAELLAHFGELERWWQTGVVGPHMHREHVVLSFRKRPPP